MSSQPVGGIAQQNQSLTRISDIIHTFYMQLQD